MAKRQKTLEGTRKSESTYLDPWQKGFNEFTGKGSAASEAEKQLSITRQQIAANEELIKKYNEMQDRSAALGMLGEYQDAIAKKDELKRKEEEGVAAVDAAKKAEEQKKAKLDAVNEAQKEWNSLIDSGVQQAITKQDEYENKLDGLIAAVQVVQLLGSNTRRRKTRRPWRRAWRSILPRWKTTTRNFKKLSTPGR